MDISYAAQPRALVLGDNIFHGHDLIEQLTHDTARSTKATVFAYHVQDPQVIGIRP